MIKNRNLKNPHILGAGISLFCLLKLTTNFVHCNHVETHKQMSKGTCISKYKIYKRRFDFFLISLNSAAYRQSQGDVIFYFSDSRGFHKSGPIQENCRIHVELIHSHGQSQHFEIMGML